MCVAGRSAFGVRRRGDVVVGRCAGRGTPWDGDHDRHWALPVAWVVDETWMRDRMRVRVAAVRRSCGHGILLHNLGVYVRRKLGVGRSALVRCGRDRER